MARPSTEALQKLLPLLRQLRDIKGVQETQPGTLHARREVFVVFHEENTILFADLKRAGGAGFDRYALTTLDQQRKLVADAKLRARRLDEE